MRRPSAPTRRSSTAGGPGSTTGGRSARAWAGRLRRDLEAEAVTASTSMEGVPVTLEEVHRILAGDRPSETREEDAALVRGYRDAMSFVLRRADDDGLPVGSRAAGRAARSRARRELGGRGRAVPDRSGVRGGRPQRRSRVPAPARRGRARARRPRVCGDAGRSRAPRRRRRLDPRRPGGHPPVPGRQRPGLEGRRLAGDVPRGLQAPGVHLARGVVGAPPLRLLRGVPVPRRRLRSRRGRHAVHPRPRGGPAPSGPGPRPPGARPAEDLGGRGGGRRRPPGSLPAWRTRSGTPSSAGASARATTGRSPTSAPRPRPTTSPGPSRPACSVRRAGPDRGRTAPETSSIAGSGPRSECPSKGRETRRGRSSSAS